VRDDPQVKSDRDMHMRREYMHICIYYFLKCIMHLRAIIGEHFDDA
jgi:hypothetical protein